MSSDTIEVFISYSKQDKELRDKLLAHLRPLETRGIITWHDRQIPPGTQWDEEIKAHLNTADIILLLISADFLNTDYCTRVEIPEALRRHVRGEATVMPIILRQCGWQYTPLAAIQAYPEKAKPITSWTDIDEAYTNVVDGVHLAAAEIRTRRNQQKRLSEQQQQKRPIEKQQKQKLTNQQKQASGPDDLSSARNINYTKLRDLLKAGDWKAADQETVQRMCEAAERRKEGWLRVEDIRRLPCTDLRTIDRLWVKYSHGKFGFSIQKQIWQECGSPTAKGANWDQFCAQVGWRMNGEWFNVRDSTSAPRGHLPLLPFFVGRTKLSRPWSLFLRATTCKL